MERQARATARAQWPGVVPLVSSREEPFAAYCQRFPLDFLLALMEGDPQRYAEYPARGFQAPEAIPSAVRVAWNSLVEQAYTSRLVVPPPLPL